MTVKLSPVFNDAQLDSSGNPLSGGLIYTYAAGTTTQTATYTTETGNVAQANPIVLNSRGEPDNPIWLTAGTAYKLTLTTSGGTVIRTIDNVDGVNDTSSVVTEWVAGPTPTYSSATVFTLAGDQTTDFHVGRRVKATLSGGAIYGRISISAYTSLTTVTAVWDSGSLDATLSAISYGLIPSTNQAVDVTGVVRAVSTDTTQTITGDKTFTGTTEINDSVFAIRDQTDTTKKVKFEASGITTATTRTVTVPDQSGTMLMREDVATQAEQETGSSTTKFVSPGRQHFNASALKVWGACGVAGDLSSPSYGVTSITDTGTGVATVVLSTAFSSSVYSAVPATFATNAVVPQVSIRNAGNFTMQAISTNTDLPVDPTGGYMFIAGGDL